MPNRSWFFASEGQQRGPYPEAQFHEFIAKSTVTAETLVWTEGMTGWQKAGDIPGLLSDTSDAVRRAGGALMRPGHGAVLSIELGLWSFLGRSLLFLIGLLLVIPAPRVATSFYRWMASRITCTGAAQLRLHRPGWRDLVCIRCPRRFYLRRMERHSVS